MRSLGLPSSVPNRFCSVRRKRLDFGERLQHVGLHAHINFLIRLISRVSFRLTVNYVYLLWLWYVPVRGLLTLSVLWLSSDLCELSWLWISRRLRLCSTGSTTSILCRCASCLAWRIQSRQLLDDLPIGPPLFSFKFSISVRFQRKPYTALNELRHTCMTLAGCIT